MKNVNSHILKTKKHTTQSPKSQRGEEEIQYKQIRKVACRGFGDRQDKTNRIKGSSGPCN